MPKRTSTLVAALSAILLSGAALAQERTAEAILADYDAVEVPQFDAEKRGDKEYTAEFLKQRQAAMESQSELIGELQAAHPDHERLEKLLPTRWSLMSGMVGDDKEKFAAMIDELDAAAKRYAGKPLGLEAMYAKAQGYSRSIRSQLATAEQMIEAAEAFVDAAPKDDERGARLLMTIAQSHTPEDKQLAAYRRVAERYPGLRTSKFALGKVRQVEGVGKPYELQFTDAITGKSVSIGDLKGKVVVVDFWATWCGPCVAEMPNMKKLYAEYKDKGVEFVGISLDNAEDKGGLKALRDYCEKNEIAWPQYYQGAGWDSEHSVSWGINSIPTMFVLDADGKLYSTQARGKLEELLPKLIEKSRG